MLLIKLISQRFALGVFLLFAVSVLIFTGTQLLPGDVAQSILGQGATPEALENMRRLLGLDMPAWRRYLQWLTAMLQGDLGTALSNNRDIASTLWTRAGNTFFLAFWAALLAVPMSILLGLVAVRYQNRWPDKLISGSSLMAISLPEFFIGYLLIYLFAVHLDWFPSISNVHAGMSFGDRMKAIALPVITLTLITLAHMMRMTRAAILNVMHSAYIETAQLKGLRRSRIIYHHALPNAAAPIANVITLNMAFLIVGVVVVEVIFVYPGMGQYLIDHVAKRDIPVVQSVGLIYAAVYIGFNTVADIISILANPRLRYPK